MAAIREPAPRGDPRCDQGGPKSSGGRSGRPRSDWPLVGDLSGLRHRHTRHLKTLLGISTASPDRHAVDTFRHERAFHRLPSWPGAPATVLYSPRGSPIIIVRVRWKDQPPKQGVPRGTPPHGAVRLFSGEQPLIDFRRSGRGGRFPTWASSRGVEGRTRPEGTLSFGVHRETVSCSNAVRS